MRIVALIPAHNEASSIAETIEALLVQRRRLDRIVVVADNCSDDTPAIAKRYPVTVYETIANTKKKPGALNQAWSLFCREADLVVCIDADTKLTPEAVGQWEADFRDYPDVAGISARFTMLMQPGLSWWQRLLVRVQRAEFSRWTDGSLRRGRTSVLAGTACCLRVSALKSVVRKFRSDGGGPWTSHSLVEDFELTFRLRQLGWTCKVSRTVRAYTDAMTTTRSLWGQRMKWQVGTVRDLLNFGLNRLTLLDWWQQFQGLFAAAVRVGWVTLLVLSAVLGQLAFEPLWLLVPALIIANDVKQAMRIPHRRPSDIATAALLIPQELFAWLRGAWFIAAWLEVLTGVKKDRWGIQARLELGR